MGNLDGTSEGGRLQVQRQLMSAAARQGVADATNPEADAAPGAAPRARLQRSGSRGDGERKVDLSAFLRGSDVGKRRSSGGTDPTVCSLRCGSAGDTALVKVRPDLTQSYPSYPSHDPDPHLNLLPPKHKHCHRPAKAAQHSCILSCISNPSGS